MSDVKLGVIGLGSMGLGMARNAIAAGIATKGYDIFPAAREAFAAAGGTPAASVAETAADVDVLIVMVVNAAQVRDAVFGPDGAAAAMRPGAVVMVCSTIAPKDAREIGRDLAEAGLLVIDTPVSGGKVGAEAGTLTLMASGPEAAFDLAAPVIAAVSQTVYRLGDEPGMGSTYKVVHQLAAGVHLAVAAEVMAFAAHAGCDTGVLADIVSKSAGRSWMFTDRVPHMLDDDFAPRSTVDIFVKDLGLVIETGHASKTPLPLAAAAHQLFLAASSMGHGQIDDSAVVKVYESATGSPVKRREN
ncbi:L-threonate dehydrogenase [Rhodobium gokarnense]|uniref:L-threonate dehydrogenase n=1 Tax=Rhodobium gokarnense TaxID=364296 RepID=A0ABT3HEX8_9HYPH|nr:L-threonate dehydrogenase [Rhodobium gokarnense]MCW2308965.1 3-hydroxyisobutyrate dehydrogenase [Rhodobium gokarnense]